MIHITQKRDTKYLFFAKKYDGIILFSIFCILCITFLQKSIISSICGRSSAAFTDAHQQHLRTLSGQLQKVAEGTNVRTTLIYPGAIKTELLNTVAPSETKTMVEEFYKNVGITPDSIANAVMYAIYQPDDVDVSDIVISPSVSTNLKTAENVEFSTMTAVLILLKNVNIIQAKGENWGILGN